MASFKEFRQTLLLYYDVDLISDEDFLILYELFSLFSFRRKQVITKVFSERYLIKGLQQRLNITNLNMLTKPERFSHTLSLTNRLKNINNDKVSLLFSTRLIKYRQVNNEIAMISSYSLFPFKTSDKCKTSVFYENIRHSTYDLREGLVVASDPVTVVISIF